MTLALIADQVIGLVLLAFVCGFVVADALRGRV